MATEKVQVNVYLDKKIVRKLDEARKLDGFSRSAVIGRLVRRYLRKMEQQKPGERSMDKGKSKSGRVSGKGATG